MREHLTPEDFDGQPIEWNFWAKLFVAAVCLCWVILAVAALT